MRRSQLMASLGKYRGPENYLTNALVTLLNELLNYNDLKVDKGLAYEILNILARRDDQPKFSDGERSINIDVQLSADPANRPDITISSGLPDGSTRLVFVEVKDSAPVDPIQLVRYRTSLDDHQDQYKCLTLLSRPSADIPPSGKDVNGVSWVQIHSLISQWDMKTEVGGYLKDSFTYLLEGKGMALNRVTGDYASQLDSVLPDLSNLFTLLTSVVNDTRVNGTKVFSNPKIEIESGDEPWIGVSTQYKRRKFAVGVYASDPTVLWYELNPNDEESNWPSKTMPLSDLTDLFEVQTAEDQRKMLEKFLQEGADLLLTRASG